MCSSIIWRRDIYLLYLWSHHWGASLSVGVFTYEFGVDPRMLFGKPSMLATVNSTETSVSLGTCECSVVGVLEARVLIATPGGDCEFRVREFKCNIGTLP